MQFNKTQEGYNIGYHVEGGETKRHHGLSMETLTDKTVLYISNDPLEWFPDHLRYKEKFVIYEVIFKDTQSMKHGWENYCLIAPVRYPETDNLPSLDENGSNLLTQTGIYFHYTDGIRYTDIGMRVDDLKEAFIINPTQFVVSILDVTSKYTSFGLNQLDSDTIN